MQSDCRKKRGLQKRKQGVSGDDQSSREQKIGGGDGNSNDESQPPLTKASKPPVSINHQVDSHNNNNNWDDREEWQGVMDKGNKSTTRSNLTPTSKLTSNVSKSTSSHTSTTSQHNDIALDRGGTTREALNEVSLRQTPSSSNDYTLSSTATLPPGTQATTSLAKGDDVVQDSDGDGDGDGNGNKWQEVRSRRVPLEKVIHYGEDWPGPQRSNSKTL
ncbi:hypothetical protein Moror_13344 [Moniliophthora roreri MCA 2997]|uniref:Uncharacterized protein n=1 Tax=Moniliophthora roreri (strain MCA 2997) TaxID=1381753 RepID=V2XYW3_MONRO|nr:hypothetical protein Moror_13344 [Moniliophthora roreri MCA 2997]